MALDFPTSPTDGQIYNNYYWDNTNSVWRLLGDSLQVAAAFSNTPTGSYTDGFDYDYISFTSSGTLTVTRGGYADVLLVGGGGAGGASIGGGGGAGGVLYIENAYIPAGSLDVVVGAGGLARKTTTDLIADIGDNGKPSSLWQYFVPGGGGGTGRQYNNGTTLYNTPGLSGGSGSGSGGGGANLALGTSGGAGVTGIGNNGGSSTTGAGGGGGGAGAVGADAVGNDGGAGGNGVSNSITGSAVTYGGGGGGAGGTTSGSGGTGGGGDGGDPATVGTANTGGGGGGTRSGNVVGLGNGGSGIVIVRVRTN